MSHTALPLCPPMRLRLTSAAAAMSVYSAPETSRAIVDALARVALPDSGSLGSKGHVRLQAGCSPGGHAGRLRAVQGEELPEGGFQ